MPKRWKLFLQTLLEMDNKRLTQIFEGTSEGSPLEEILNVSRTVNPSIDTRLIREVHDDLCAYFSGNHPQFRKSTMPYHNLRHTQMVALASIRLFHGLHCNNVHITANTYLKGVLAAYFHDTGMLLLEDDPAESGTEYIAGHEARSIQFLQNYAKEKDLPEDIARDCAVIINYTDLKKDPATFNFHSHEIQLAGQVVGSSDILAQMADRYYLECLPLLYNEQKEGGVNSHESALELMEKTAQFYYEVVLKRLIVTFSHTSRAMRYHFKERYKIDRNLYIENIDKNIVYLKEIIKRCETIDCLRKYLKRTPPGEF